LTLEKQAILTAKKPEMKRPHDEILMAYADGALTPEKAGEVERFLQADNEARKMVEAFRRTRELAHAAFDAPMREAPPRRLVDTIMTSPAPAGARGSAPPRRMARWPMARMAMAASAAVIAGLGLGLFLLGRDEESPIALGKLSTDDALSAALTRLASGTPDMAEARVITVLTTFRDAAHRPCREFEMSDTSPTAPRIMAVACRDGSAWRIEGAAWLRAGGANNGGDFAPAGSEGADPLTGLLKRLGAEATLAPEEEAALIAGDWQEKTGE
jgi:anti-sigma-K factor RskA